jgi:hypothetical protein
MSEKTITNDILYFKPFGEWRDSLQAEIKSNGKTAELLILSVDIALKLKTIEENPNFKEPKEF